MKFVVLLSFLVHILASDSITDARETTEGQVGEYRLWYRQPSSGDQIEGEWEVDPETWESPQY